jgi:hypothetical protein
MKSSVIFVFFRQSPQKKSLAELIFKDLDSKNKENNYYSVFVT